MTIFFEATSTPSSKQFLTGMYVRVPIEADRNDREFRDFRIGQLRSLNEIFNTGYVQLLEPTFENSLLSREYDLDTIRRCRILPDTKCIETTEGKLGTILMCSQDEPVPEQMLFYYVQVEGEKSPKLLSEAVLRVSATRQDPQALQQLQDYEFHNPIWKTERDELVSVCTELHNATFGLEDLVSSRIRLLPHQAEVVARVLSDPQCRYILADEVGLGKTIEACVILKGLQRRKPDLKTLLVVPASLLQQWYNELNTKFWLNFKIFNPNTPAAILQKGEVGYLISTEDLVTQIGLWESLTRSKWDLLIVDEAHHLAKAPLLYERIRWLSSLIPSCLILSATPIQRRADEYLALLAVLNPQRYDPAATNAFRHILTAQAKLRTTTAYLTKSLNPDDFDPAEFARKIAPVVASLPQDSSLPQMVARVATQLHQPDQGLAAARDALAYISENYRIESRIIRNRRDQLQISLPERAVNTNYSYVPSEVEVLALRALHDYLDHYLTKITHDPLVAEYCRILLHAAYSSPYALQPLLSLRQTCLRQKTQEKLVSTQTLLVPAAPRAEATRIQGVIRLAPILETEAAWLENLQWQLDRWQEQIDYSFNSNQYRQTSDEGNEPNRLVQILRAIRVSLKKDADVKIILFSSWQPTLEVISKQLIAVYGKEAVAQFDSSLTGPQLQVAADTFQTNERCHFMVCDELGGEGRNFQIADQIIHIDLPWTPAQIEQRIGRVDRLGRSGTVLSLIPFAQGWLEQDLFEIWQDAFQLFTHSMSGMEIALETVQSELMEAILNSPRRGVTELLPTMLEKAAELRETVQEERYFEEAAINRRRRQEFHELAEKYRDGSLLRTAFMGWANLIGLSGNYQSHSDTLIFNPRHFRAKSMSNAKFFQPPDMQEALRRSGRVNNLVINGTFNRDIAVKRENLVFFAAGNDPWTDTIIANAFETDRGRCCAIERAAPTLEKDWEGFQLLYSLTVDPRPLFAAGFDPTHLFRAAGYLTIATYQLLISSTGKVLAGDSKIGKIIRQDFDKKVDLHLGKRDGTEAGLAAFKLRYPEQKWEAVLERVFTVAKQTMVEELDFMPALAEEAQAEFEHHTAGQRAAYQWLQANHFGQGLEFEPEITQYERVSAELVRGIQQPLCRLESVCFWSLRGKPANV